MSFQRKAAAFVTLSKCPDASPTLISTSFKSMFYGHHDCRNNLDANIFLSIRGLSSKFVDKACKIFLRQNKMRYVCVHFGSAFNFNCAWFNRFWCYCLDFMAFFTHVHTCTAHFSDVNDVYMKYQRRIHASLKPPFWNYPYHWHNILLCQASTINKQHSTLSTVFQDNNPSVQERFLTLS